MGSPSIGGDLTGSITEGEISIGGDLDDVGFTGNDDDIFSITAQGSYGTATIDASTGGWVYELDNTNPAVIALDTGETLTDVFTVSMEDTSGSGSGQVVTEDVLLTINGVTCFAAGTCIKTPKGSRPIETLGIDELVALTGGATGAIRWIGSRALTAAALESNPNLRPVRIRRNALGKGIPSSDLVVSPQHRILVRSGISRQMFGTDEVLVPAKHLCELSGIDVAYDLREITYYHIMFDQHQIITANGAETESLYAGREALKSVGSAALEEILELFPELKDGDYVPPAARLLVKGGKGRLLAARHGKNRKALVT